MEKDALLGLQKVCFSYEDSPFTLRELSVSIYEGERVAVLGGNGAGKSTFFLLCNGILVPDSGSISYRGEPVTGKRRDLMWLRERVGVVFQDPDRQFVGPTVESEVSFGPMNLGLERDEVALRVTEALDSMEMSAYREQSPYFLSGGQKKRVAIAGVLAMRPELILFDEPTAALDPAGAEMLEGVLARLSAEGRTLVVSTHDVDFAWRWADRLLIFSDGELLADGPPEMLAAADDLLERAGLRAPALCGVAKALTRRGLLPSGCLPRTVGELEKQLDQANIFKENTI